MIQHMIIQIIAVKEAQEAWTLQKRWKLWGNKFCIMPFKIFFWNDFTTDPYLFDTIWIIKFTKYKGVENGFYVNKSETPIYWNDRISEFDDSWF